MAYCKNSKVKSRYLPKSIQTDELQYWLLGKKTPEIIFDRESKSINQMSFGKWICCC